MLVAVYFLGVDFQTQIYEKSLVFLMDGLIALRVGSFYDLQYFGVLYNAVVDIQQKCFPLDRVQFCDDPFYLDVFERLLLQIGEFIEGKLGNQLENFHLTLRS